MIKVAYHNINRMLYDNTKTGWVIFCGTENSACRYAPNHPLKFHDATISKQILKALRDLLPVRWRSLNRTFYTNQFGGKQLCLTYYGYHGSEIIYKAVCKDIPVPKKMNYTSFESWGDEVLMTTNCEVTKARVSGGGYLYMLTATDPQDERLLIQGESPIAASKKAELEEDILERASNQIRRGFLLDTMRSCSADDDFDRVRRNNHIPEELQDALAHKLASMKDENDAVLFLHSPALRAWADSLQPVKEEV